MPLTQDQINALLSSSRTKGGYVTRLNEFVKGGEAGVCVNEDYPEMAEKKANTLKQGFENAKNSKEAVDGAENVKVITNGDKDDAKVFLINLTAAGVGDAATVEEEDEDLVNA